MKIGKYNLCIVKAVTPLLFFIETCQYFRPENVTCLLFK